ncbi:MAG: M15 family metallopeptidase, partial [Verrucomicrobiota bacterium]
MPNRSVATLPPLLLIALLLVQCAWREPDAEEGAKVGAKTARKAESQGLLNVQEASPDIRVDIRYATRMNVTQKRLYPPNMPAYLTVDTSRRLARAQAELRQKGYSLKVWDAYRPPRAHMALWKAAPDSTYVVKPSPTSWSRHTLGLAVDVTLVDRNGQEVRMPTEFDAFTPAASSRYIGSDPVIRKNLQILQTAMRNAGFSTIPSEWW